MEEMSVSPSVERLDTLGEQFKVFGDGTRLRILFLLLLRGERCVREIAKEIGVSISAVSHQLRILRQARLVSCRRDGKEIRYALADDHVESILRLGMEHVLESEDKR